MLICKHLNQANKGCGKGSEEAIAKQGPEGSILCFDGMHFYDAIMSS
jgi:hypothetical protein